MFELGIVFLGLSAAVFGGWLERAGPRKAGVVAAFCWGGGFLIGAYAVYIHQLWLLWLGVGIIGGIGLGLGYISPVSTLIKWFPDRRGMATGMAIMGFGGGALIGSPLANLLINHFKSPTEVGVWQTLPTMEIIYIIAMLIGAFGYRVPANNWLPAGSIPSEHLLWPWDHSSRLGAHVRAYGLEGAVRRRLPRHPLDVRRRLWRPFRPISPMSSARASSAPSMSQSRRALGPRR